MQSLLGILLVMAGIVFPMAMPIWLAGRLQRQPKPRPIQMGMLLALNGVLPVGLIVTGLGLLSPAFGATPGARAAAGAAAVATLALLAGLWLVGRGGNRGR